MTQSDHLPPIDELKAQAQRLRKQFEGEGLSINHAKSLELLAQQHGYRNWNTLRAKAEEAEIGRDRALRFAVGQRVRGAYLGHAFEGEVVSAQRMGEMATRLAIHFDEPVDVVESTHFSSFRRRIHCTINSQGVTAECTSNGEPQVRIFR